MFASRMPATMLPSLSSHLCSDGLLGLDVYVCGELKITQGLGVLMPAPACG
jgi:hypothetical protein